MLKNFLDNLVFWFIFVFLAIAFTIAFGIILFDWQLKKLLREIWELFK